MGAFLIPLVSLPAIHLLIGLCHVLTRRARAPVLLTREMAMQALAAYDPRLGLTDFAPSPDRGTAFGRTGDGRIAVFRLTGADIAARAFPAQAIRVAHRTSRVRITSSASREIASWRFAFADPGFPAFTAPAPDPIPDWWPWPMPAPAAAGADIAPLGAPS